MAPGLLLPWRHAQGMVVNTCVHYMWRARRMGDGVVFSSSAEAKQPRNAPKWVTKERRREFMEAVAAAKGFQVSEVHRWREVAVKDLEALGGGPMLRRRYNGSIYAALIDLFPEIEFNIRETRRKLPNRFWASPENRRHFMDDLARRHGVARMGDWKKVSTTDVAAMGGAGLLNRHKSFFALLQETYPEGYKGEEWEVFACRDHVPHGHWRSLPSVVEFVERASRELGLATAEDWYRVSVVQLSSVPGGAGLLTQMSLFQILSLARPKEVWDETRLASSGKKSTQRSLFLRLAAIFN